MIETAIKYTSIGFSVVPVGQDKWPINFGWKRYQSEIAKPEDIKAWPVNTHGIAVICGKVSGGLEVIDFDLKNDISARLFEDYMQLVIDVMPDLAAKLVIAESRSKGRHIYYRCDNYQGNKKLASRPASDDEMLKAPNLKIYGLIETRGEGGLIVCHPAPGYSWLQGDLTKVPVISNDQRDELINAARSFNQVIEIVQEYNHSVQVDSTYDITPWKDYNERGDVLDLLKSHGYTILPRQGDNIRIRRPGKDVGISGDFNVYKRWFTLFTTSTEFESQKAYSPASVFCKLVCKDDWKVAYQRLIADGYGRKKEIPTNIKEDLILKFWYVSVNKKGEQTIGIDRPKLRIFLKELGFYLYYHDPALPNYDIVMVENNLVSFSASSIIIEKVRDYVLSLPDQFDGIYKNDIFNLVADKLTLLAEPKYQNYYIDRLDSIGRFLKDTRDHCFIPYLNGIVKISKDGIELISYLTSNKLIWKRALVQRVFNLIDKFSMQCEYDTFIEKISKDDNKETWVNRKVSAYTIIGYLIHRYKNPITPKAVILMEQCDDYDKGGGTGKGIFAQALSEIVNVVRKVGKSFDPGATFAFQDVSPHTAIININDTGRNFKIEDYNSIITDAIHTERKNKDSITLSYEESPKLLIDMNYSITEMAASAQRRIIRLEFSDYFSEDHTPVKEFGHALFKDWDDIEYNRFDNFMVNCIHLYLKNGVIEVDISETGKVKSIKQRCGLEFYDWFKDWSESDVSKKPVKSSDLYSSFLEFSSVGKDYSVQSFGRSLMFACKAMGYNLNLNRSTEPGRQRVAWIGNGVTDDVISRSEYLQGMELPF